MSRKCEFIDEINSNPRSTSDLLDSVTKLVTYRLRKNNDKSVWGFGGRPTLPQDAADEGNPRPHCPPQHGSTPDPQTS